tara:strand:- start:326 stop:502 length:177 start_codon:yes stop_codon:yes gene_type:complete
MERKRLSYRDKLWIAKEEVKDLERLLEEAQRRLNNEYDNIGGRTWWQWVWYIAGWHYD